MRIGIGGLALASILVTSSVSISGCSAPEPPEAAAPVALSLPLAEGGHGVLSAQSAVISIKGKKGDYSQAVTMTPNWWVGGGEFKIVWYAGMSQTKRFFQFGDETGDPAERPPYLRAPEEGVRQVTVSFDGNTPLVISPRTARALFKIPTGAKGVTRVEMDFGPQDKPTTYVWK